MNTNLKPRNVEHRALLVCWYLVKVNGVGSVNIENGEGNGFEILVYTRDVMDILGVCRNTAIKVMKLLKERFPEYPKQSEISLTTYVYITELDMIKAEMLARLYRPNWFTKKLI